MEREEFLARVREAAQSLGETQAVAGLPAPSNFDDPVEEFTRTLEAIDGEVHTGDPYDVVLGLAGEHRTFLSWSPAELPLSDLPERLQRAGLEMIDPAVPPDTRLAHQSSYLEVSLGITGADAAFAESGSIVVTSGPGRPRMASLIPLVHVALLPVDRIWPSLSDWVAATGGIPDAANVVFISGPSRTGDIEQHLNLGVHGPKRLHVVLLPSTVELAGGAT